VCTPDRSLLAIVRTCYYPFRSGEPHLLAIQIDDLWSALYNSASELGQYDAAFRSGVGVFLSGAVTEPHT